MRLTRTREQRVTDAQTAQVTAVEDALTAVDIEFNSLMEELDAMVEATPKRDATTLVASLYWLAPVIQAVRLGLTTQQPLVINESAVAPLALGAAPGSTDVVTDPIVTRINALATKMGVDSDTMVTYAENVFGPLPDNFGSREAMIGATTLLERVTAGQVEHNVDGSLKADDEIAELTRELAKAEADVVNERNRADAKTAEVDAAYQARNDAKAAQRAAEDALAPLQQQVADLRQKLANATNPADDNQVATWAELQSAKEELENNGNWHDVFKDFATNLSVTTFDTREGSGLRSKTVEVKVITLAHTGMPDELKASLVDANPKLDELIKAPKPPAPTP